MKLTVTQKHIDAAVPGCDNKCPIALAFEEQGFRDLSMNRQTNYSENGAEGWYLTGTDGQWCDYTYAASLAAGRFAVRFDNYKPVKPATFTFTLERKHCPKSL